MNNPEPYSRSRTNVFPLSDTYRKRMAAGTAKLREGGGRRAREPLSERHLQCVWYNPDLRPKRLRDSKNEEIIVIDPGRWNLESGPDFLDAVLEIRPERRRVCGDIEIHVDPADWIAHRHESDPRYARVCAHITYFEGPLPAQRLPSGTLQIGLRKQLMSNPYFAFENIDITAYPYDLARKSAPCAETLQRLDREHKQALLRAGGQERMRRKAEIFRSQIHAQGPEQTLYTQIMRALGYKHNMAGLRYLAEILPASALRDESEGDPERAYALLMGLAGLLPENPAPKWDGETRDFIRRIWDHWWRMRDRWQGFAIDPECWRRSGVRPQNRIERRLMAAAQLFASERPLADEWRELAESEQGASVAIIVDELRRMRAGYWARRLSWSGKPQAKPSALIGRSRAGAVAANVFIPFAAATGALKDDDALDRIPAEQLNSIMRTTASLLFGPAHPRSLYSSAVERQGLMQIFHDFCLDDRSGCRDCGFPKLIRDNWEINSSS